MIFSAVVPSPRSFPNATHTLWTVVNRGGLNLTGAQLRVVPSADSRYFDCYHGVEITPTDAPPPLPPPPPPPAGYAAFPGFNCFAGHGGDEIDTTPVSGLSAAQCAARCDADHRCDCVTYAASSENCWKRAKCEPGAFAADASYATYVKSTGYFRYPGEPCNGFGELYTARLHACRPLLLRCLAAGRNCYNGHGGEPIDDDHVPTGYNVSHCEARCDADAECACVTYRLSDGACFKRSGCAAPGAASAFAVDSAYDTYIAAKRIPPCVPALSHARPAS